MKTQPRTGDPQHVVKSTCSQQSRITILCLSLFASMGLAQPVAPFSDASPHTASSTEIERLFKQLDTAEWQGAIRAIEALNTHASQAALLGIALGQRPPRVQEWAATCYLKAASSPSEARGLLSAENPNVVAAGLLALKGEEIDALLFAHLKHLANSPSGHVRRCCMLVIAEAPRAAQSLRPADMVVGSIRTVKEIQAKERLVGFAGAPGKEFTEEGLTYFRIVQALATAPTIALSDLIRLTPRDLGLERECVVIARAWRGDASVRDEIGRICVTEQHPNIRAAALNGFAFVGTGEDIALLEHVADTNSYRIALTSYEQNSMRFHLPAGAVVPQQVYPNRQRASALIKRIRAKERRTNGNPRVQ